MKAAQYNAYGDTSVIEINPNAQKPTPTDNQVLAEVSAATLNPIDSKVRLGYLKDMVPLTFPVTTGSNFSGVIVEVGKNVTEFKIGDEVYGQSIVLNGGSGSIAEFATTSPKNIALKPTTLDHVHAAALPLIGSSAIQALEEHMSLQSGQKILIHGGAGGIGSIAIQLAKHIGAYVITTVGSDSEGKEFVKSLGADEVIDYKTQKFEEIVKDVDAVFDTVGGVTQENSFKVLKKGGILVSMIGKPSEELAKKYGVTSIGQNTNTSRAHLERLKELVEKGIVKVQIDKEFSLDQAREAFEYFETQHPRGKVVVRMK